MRKKILNCMCCSETFVVMRLNQTTCSEKCSKDWEDFQARRLRLAPPLPSSKKVDRPSPAYAPWAARAAPLAQAREPKGAKRRRLKALVGSRNADRSFFESEAWQLLRYRVIKYYGRVCMACHARDVEIHVDHIQPRSTHPDLALEFDNLQVLCRPCNLGKGTWDETDWRPSRKPTKFA